ncbi:MAG TPA: hypothetical protein VM406_04210 [Noviherbaspirillum sp.]|nr:hypothetical protein [Noviherbaspirillum sp.]
MIDDYTAHSRLRVLNRVAEGLQRRLGKQATKPEAAAPVAQKEAA